MFRAIYRGADLERLEQASLPPALHSLLRHALAPDPAQRFQSASALARALEGIIKDLPDEPELPLPSAPMPAEPEEHTALDALQPTSTCGTCGAVFDTAEELVAHAPYCGVPERQARDVPAEAFLPPTDDDGPPLELAYEPARPTDVRCDFCGEWFGDEQALTAHWPGCRMRQWHERNFQAQPAVMQQARLETPDGGDVIPGFMDRMKRWLRRPAAPTVDELTLLRRQVEALQDGEASKLGNKGLDVLGQMLEMLRGGLPDDEMNGVVQPRLLETARRLVQLCTSLQFGRRFLAQFPPATVDRELAALHARRASPDAVARKEALLRDARAVEAALQEHQERLEGILDSLGRSAARLHVAMVEPSPEERQAMSTTLDGLLGDLDALGSAVREMRRLGLG